MALQSAERQAAPPQEPGRKYRALFCALLFLPCLLLVLKPDNDVWFLLSSGRYVLNHGIPYTDPLSMHQGLAFVMQQWLSAAIFWADYSRFGAAGLIALIALVYACFMAAAFRFCMRLSQGNFLVSYAVALLGGSLLHPFMVTRPDAITALTLMLEMVLLEGYIGTGKLRYLALLPVLSLTEVNLHSSMWILLFLVLLPYLIDAFSFQLFFIRGQGYPKLPLFVSAALMTAAGFLNPYGVWAMTYLFRSYGYSYITNSILEMRPPDINTGAGKLIFGTLLAVAAVYFFYRKGGTRLRYVLLALGTAYMALSSGRSYQLFIVCGFFPLACRLKDLRPPEKPLVPAGPKTQRLRRGLVLLLCAELAAVGIWRGASLPDAVKPPAEASAVDYIQKNAAGGQGILYTGFNEGGYAEFKGLKPYMDPRAEVFVKANNRQFDYMYEYILMLRGRLYYRDFLDKYRFPYVLANIRNDPLSTDLPHDPDYRMVYRDAGYCVYKRVD